MVEAGQDARAPFPLSPEASESSLLRAVEQISSELELETLLVRVIECACILVSADNGSLGLYEAASDTIHTSAVHRLPASELTARSTRGVGLAGQVLLTGQSVTALRADFEPTLPAELVGQPVIGVPLHWKNELIGCVCVSRETSGTFAPSAADKLSDFCRHAAIAIENARRYARERRRTARFELIARVARIINGGVGLDRLLRQTADAIHDVLEFPNVDIPLLDPVDPGVLVINVRGGGYKQKIPGVDRLLVSEGIMGAAVRERRSQRVDDVTLDPRYVQPPASSLVRAELAVPIMLGSEVLGVVNVEGNNPFDELDQRTIEIVADHLAAAIRNARLVDHNRDAAVWQERQRLRRELHDSVTQILSSISLLAQALAPAWRSSHEEGERRTARLIELAQTAFAEMRALLRELQPPGENSPAISQRGRSFLGLDRLKHGGLGPALTRLLDTMIPETLARRYNFDEWIPQYMPHEEALYRVCQEAVSNVIRHSGANYVEVEARVTARSVLLTVRDDGCGMPESVSGGIGLKSMQHRIKSLGGVFRMRKIETGGLEVEAALPRQDRSLESPVQ